MQIHTKRMGLSLALLVAVMPACGGRSIPLLRDGGSSDTSISTDAAQKDGPPASESGVTPSGCSSNKSCPDMFYCHFEAGCGETGPGVCMLIPRGCDMDCPGVCGCDGVFYCNACMANAAGVNVAHNGECIQKSCSDLNQAYVTEVQQAKSCCPVCDSIQCTFRVDSELGCPCDTYVNTVTQLMKELPKLWNTKKCQQGWDCPAIACPDVFSGECAGSGATGTCQDVFSP